MKKISTLPFILISLLFLSACTTPSKMPTALDLMKASLVQGAAIDKTVSQHAQHNPPIPPSIDSQLIPTVAPSMPSGSYRPGRKFSISVHDVPAQTFFLTLVQGTNQNMVVSPKVTGKISIELKNVTIDDALAMVHDTYGYEYRRTPAGYEILPRQLETRMFNVNYLDVTRTGKSDTEITSGQISEVIQGPTGVGAVGGVATTQNIPRTQSSVITKSKMDFWPQLATTLKLIIGTGEGRAVVVNPEGALVFIKAYPNELLQAAQYLDSLENTMDRQVILEAKILEVNLNNYYQAGIDWKILGAQLNALEGIQQFPGTNIDNFKFPTAFHINISSGPDFNAVIRLLGTQGNVQVLSSPRVATINNQKAVIKVGNDEFFVTGISSQTTQTTINSSTPTQSVILTPFFSGITLDVTPQIAQDGNVTLHIHPAISLVTDQNKHFVVNGQPNELPLALSTIRETDTIVQAQNGQVIILGGLMQNTTREDIAQLPFFGNIPFLGTLFRNTKQVSSKSELVILLRPVVVNHDVQTNVLQIERGRYQQFPGFHFGDRPDIFGTLGEQHVPVTFTAPRPCGPGVQGCQRPTPSYVVQGDE